MFKYDTNWDILSVDTLESFKYNLLNYQWCYNKLKCEVNCCSFKIESCQLCMYVYVPCYKLE